MNAIRKLIALSSVPAATRSVDPLKQLSHPSRLRMCFESALVILPQTHLTGVWGVEDVTAPSWTRAYPVVQTGTVFALDLVGGLFLLTADGVSFVDPEFGEVETIAPTLCEWAEAVLDDFEYWTRHSICREWQLENGALAEGERLAPHVPVVLGGRVEVSNLVRARMERLRDAYASLCVEVSALEDGVQATVHWPW